MLQLPFDTNHPCFLNGLLVVVAVGSGRATLVIAAVVVGVLVLVVALASVVVAMVVGMVVAMVVLEVIVEIVVTVVLVVVDVGLVNEVVVVAMVVMVVVEMVLTKVVIQSSALSTFAYTPGNPAEAQPAPQETTPTRVAMPSTTVKCGPPLSP
jgi:hypothetical protein